MLLLNNNKTDFRRFFVVEELSRPFPMPPLQKPTLHLLLDPFLQVCVFLVVPKSAQNKKDSKKVRLALSLATYTTSDHRTF